MVCSCMCCGCATCVEGGEGLCCCGDECCLAGEYCCDGVCQYGGCECDCSSLVTASSTMAAGNIINQPCCQAVCIVYRVYDDTAEEWIGPVTVCMPLGGNTSDPGLDTIFQHSADPFLPAFSQSASCVDGQVVMIFGISVWNEDSAEYQVTAAVDFDSDCCVVPGSLEFVMTGGGPTPEALEFDTLEVLSVTVVTGESVVYGSDGSAVDEYAICGTCIGSCNEENPCVAGCECVDGQCLEECAAACETNCPCPGFFVTSEGCVYLETGSYGYQPYFVDMHLYLTIEWEGRTLPNVGGQDSHAGPDPHWTVSGVFLSGPPGPIYAGGPSLGAGFDYDKSNTTCYKDRCNFTHLQGYVGAQKTSDDGSCIRQSLWKWDYQIACADDPGGQATVTVETQGASCGPPHSPPVVTLSFMP